MPSIPSGGSDSAQEKLDKLLHNQISWIGEVGKSLERSDEHIKQRMLYSDRLAVLSGAVIAFSVPAFASLQAPSRTISHRYTSLSFAIGGWIFLFIAMIGSVATHYLLVELYAMWTVQREGNVQSVLFGNLNLVQKRMMRDAGGDPDELKKIDVPELSFRRQPWHERITSLLLIAFCTTMLSFLLGTSGILTFLIFSSF